MHVKTDKATTPTNTPTQTQHTHANAFARAGEPLLLLRNLLCLLFVSILITYLVFSETIFKLCSQKERVKLAGCESCTVNL